MANVCLYIIMLPLVGIFNEYLTSVPFMSSGSTVCASLVSSQIKKPMHLPGLNMGIRGLSSRVNEWKSEI